MKLPSLFAVSPHFLIREYLKPRIPSPRICNEGPAVFIFEKLMLAGEVIIKNIYF